MWTYRPPLQEIRFVINEVLRAPARWRELPALADSVDTDTALAVLEEAAKFATEVLAPLNRAGDLEGCHWHEGRVRTPAGFRQAYAAWVEGAWASLACHAEDGGQGLPHVVKAAFDEMMLAANHAWMMYPGLLHGAYECLRQHGSSALRERYLPKLASGEWLATMNLTEPQAGSDLGMLRTRAQSRPDGSWSITGSKIFISGGDHDLTDNIVHLVLARTPDAPAGTRGLSLFLAPRVLPDGRTNAVRCDGIERKMGIKASATCSMSFDGAIGWLVGELNQGLAAMFVMMNAARLHVAIQGLAHLQSAQQNAVDYALERVQGRGQPIAAHPALRRMLWRLRALAEGQRVLAYWGAMALDDAQHHPEPAAREAAEVRLGLLTPVLKSFLTENGHVGASQALQAWGGHGYVHEFGIEQVVRDSRIAMLYEGTNEIQAIDLVQRKVLADGGARMLALLEALASDLDVATDFGGVVASQVDMARTGMGQLIEAAARDRALPLHVADDFLRGIGYVLLAWAWGRMASAAAARSGEAWYDDRLAAARYGRDWLLCEVLPCWERVANAAAPLPSLAA